MKKNKTAPKKNKISKENPVKPQKNIPVKPDKDPDPTVKPVIKDPKKIDPTRIEEPEKTDPTRKNNLSNSIQNPNLLQNKKQQVLSAEQFHKFPLKQKQQHNKANTGRHRKKGGHKSNRSMN